MNQTLATRRVLLPVMLLACLVGAVTATPAQAAPSLSASKTSGIDPAGETVTVRGSGYDPDSGVYVTVCVDNGVGAQPTPCLGGITEDGEATPYSAWYSNDPQWEGVATTWDGSFSVALRVQAVSGRTDCRTAPRGCVLVTRGDHTQGWSRQITRLPISFAGAAQAPVATAAPPAPATRAPSAGAPTRASAPVATRAPVQTAAAAPTGGVPAASGSASAPASPSAAGAPGAPSAATTSSSAPGASASPTATAEAAVVEQQPSAQALAAADEPAGTDGSGTSTALVVALVVVALAAAGGAGALLLRRRAATT